MISERNQEHYVGDYCIIHSWDCDFKTMELYIYKKSRFKRLQSWNILFTKGFVANYYLKGKCFFCEERCYGQHHNQCEANHMNKQRDNRC